MAVPVKTGGAFEHETPQMLFETALSVAWPKQTYAVSADGQRFLLNTPAGGPSSSLTITLNWSAGLKARVPAK